MSGGRSIGTANLAMRLYELGDPQYLPQTLVLDHGALINFTELVVDGVGLDHAAGTNLDASVGELEYLDVLADQSTGVWGFGQQVEFALVVQCQALRHLAQLAPSEDQVEIFIGADRPMCVVQVPRCLAENHRALIDRAELVVGGVGQ